VVFCFAGVFSAGMISQVSSTSNAWSYSWSFILPERFMVRFIFTAGSEGLRVLVLPGRPLFNVMAIAISSTVASNTFFILS
jgi:hypothetical protein